MVRPVVPNNKVKWQVFDSTQQIVKFLQEEVEFSAKNQSSLQSIWRLDHLAQFNKLPKGLITFEGIFNLDDQVKGRAMNLAARKGDYRPISIANGKFLNLGKVCYKIDQDVYTIL